MASFGGQETLYQPGDMPYGELALVHLHNPSGAQALHVLDWQTQRPVKLTPQVQRLTAPNPGAMTGPGTNSYLVGNPQTGYIAIDPGPNDAAHLHHLWLAAADSQGQPGDIRHIICTHSHPDHSPGAQPLQALCTQAGRVTPPILGLASGPHARPNATFTPDRELLNRELIALYTPGENANSIQPQISNCHVQALHTPGHAANHLCLVLVPPDGQPALLFSGDHILNGSTTVIDPPDGNMGAYLDSLDLLSTACTAYQIDYILPAHGWVLGYPNGGAIAAIAHLKAHRLQRETKITTVMRALPHGSLDDWVAQAYDDVPPRLWPVAKRSLLAHVERIRALHSLPS